MTTALSADSVRQIASLKNMMTWPSKQHIIDILQRRIYALENEVFYTNPFNEVDETLYAIWRGPIPAPVVAQHAPVMGEIDWDDFR